MHVNRTCGCDGTCGCTNSVAVNVLYIRHPGAYSITRYQVQYASLHSDHRCTKTMTEHLCLMQTRETAIGGLICPTTTVVLLSSSQLLRRRRSSTS